MRQPFRDNDDAYLVLLGGVVREGPITQWQTRYCWSAALLGYSTYSNAECENGKNAAHSESPLLILDVFRHASQRSFGCVDVARSVDGNPFTHGSLRGICLVRGNEGRDFAIFETPDPDSPEPARMDLFRRFGVGRVNNVILIDGQPAGATEVVVFSDEFAILRQDLDAMVVAIGDDQPAFRIEFERVRRPKLSWPGSRFADGSEELSVFIEYGDSADQIGV